MRVTEEELIDIWQYFQYCCLPSIVMARYAYNDYVKDIKEEKMFCRHEVKFAINKIGKYLEMLPNKLMDVSPQNIRYMNILSDSIEEQFEDETEELHRAIYITFRNAKAKHLECLSAIHYISAMIQIAAATFRQCCYDLKKIMHKDVAIAFHTYDLQDIVKRWEEIVDKATVFFGYDKMGKKDIVVDLNNPRCCKAIDCIRRKYASIDTLKAAMKAAYPWSPNYKEDIPFEQSVDYLITDNNQKSA